MDMQTSLSLNGLACAVCKARKVRCDKVIPRCGRCKEQNVDCKYPTQRKKKSVKTSKARATELAALVDRLQRVENIFQWQQRQPALPLCGSSKVNAKTSSTSSLLSTPASSAGVANLDTHGPVSPWSEAFELQADNDIYKILKNAIEKIQATKLRATFRAVRSTQSIDIPRNLAKSWIKSYFDSMPTNMTSTLSEYRELLQMMPDLIDQTHIHIEPAMQVIFYVIIYHGCCLPRTDAMDMPDPQSYCYLNHTYILALRSLPAWQRSITGSILDLTAAIMMTRAAAERHDVDLGYKLHKLSCEFAEGLNLHKLDSDPELHGPSNPGMAAVRTDVERRRFWDLVQYDIYFRLMLNKPSALATPMAEWRVNLPYLRAGIELGSNTEPAIVFLFYSRVTFEIIAFFKLLDDFEQDDKRSLLPQVETICEKMQALYEEWQIDNVLDQIPITQVNGWLIADAAIAGLMSIILMLRTIGVVHSPLALESARQVLRIVDLMLAQAPTLDIMSLSFFSFMAFFPYASVADTVLQHPGNCTGLAGDVALLEKLREVVGRLCRVESDFLPLFRAMQHACNEIKMKSNN